MGSDFIRHFGSGIFGGKTVKKYNSSIHADSSSHPTDVVSYDGGGNSVSPPSGGEQHPHHSHLSEPVQPRPPAEYTDPKDVEYNIVEQIRKIKRIHLFEDGKLPEAEVEVDPEVEGRVSDFMKELTKYNGEFDALEKLMSSVFVSLGDRGMEDMVLYSRDFMSAYGNYDTSGMMKAGEKLAYGFTSLVPLYAERKKNYEARLRIVDEVRIVLADELELLRGELSEANRVNVSLRSELSYKDRFEVVSKFLENSNVEKKELLLDKLSMEESVGKLVRNQEDIIGYISKYEKRKTVVKKELKERDDVVAKPVDGAGGDESDDEDDSNDEKSRNFVKSGEVDN